MSLAVLEIEDWILEADISVTMEHSAAIAQDHCTCGYCQNFYQSIDTTFPNLRRFLAQFGVDPEGPDELLPFEPTLLLASYAVAGRILRRGNHPIYVDGIPVLIESGSRSEVISGCPAPYFVVSVGEFELPWILEEDMNEVISPANDPACLERIFNRWLLRQNDNSLYS